MAYQELTSLRALDFEQRDIVLARERDELLAGKGLGEQVALDLVASLLAQEPLLRLRLHALGDNGKVQGLAERDDRVGDSAVVGIDREIANERAIYLDCIDWELLDE